MTGFVSHSLKGAKSTELNGNIVVVKTCMIVTHFIIVSKSSFSIPWPLLNRWHLKRSLTSTNLSLPNLFRIYSRIKFIMRWAHTCMRNGRFFEISTTTKHSRKKDFWIRIRLTQVWDFQLLALVIWSDASSWIGTFLHFLTFHPSSLPTVRSKIVYLKGRRKRLRSEIIYILIMETFWTMIKGGTVIRTSECEAQGRFQGCEGCS